MLPAYLERLGLATAPPSLGALAELVAAHVRTVPFENLDPLRGVPVDLAPDALERKLLRGGRGGYCFEHNLVLLDALRALGYRADGLLARVRWGVPPGTVTNRSHMLVQVDLDEPWIVDVGFGGYTLTAPLRLVAGPAQDTPHGPFRLVDAGADALELQARLQGEWRPLYTFDAQRQTRIDYEMASWWTSTHPTSYFRNAVVAGRVDGPARITLRNTDLAFTRGDEVERVSLRGVDGVLGALREHFGVAVPDDPALPEAIARLIG
ncbi:MAG: arylamine N-acetyltransferase [Myxococcota bacterium]